MGKFNSKKALVALVKKYGVLSKGAMKLLRSGWYESILVEDHGRKVSYDCLMLPEHTDSKQLIDLFYELKCTLLAARGTSGSPSAWAEYSAVYTFRDRLPEHIVRLRDDFFADEEDWVEHHPQSSYYYKLGIVIPS